MPAGGALVYNDTLKIVGGGAGAAVPAGGALVYNDTKMRIIIINHG